MGNKVNSNCGTPLSGSFYAPVGQTDEYGEVVILQHAHMFEHECMSSIASAMWQARFDGTLGEWLEYLKWDVRKFEFSASES